MGKNVLSLFSSAGIGELGIKASGLHILLSNELLSNRCALYKENYPETECICGDIWEKKTEIIQRWDNFNAGNPFLIYATPPCQGMSFNSVGKRLQEIRRGRKPKDDPRNQLIIPTIEIVKALRPDWLLLENVQEMQNTIIPVKDGEYMNIIDYIRCELASYSYFDTKCKIKRQPEIGCIFHLGGCKMCKVKREEIAQEICSRLRGKFPG